MNTNPTEIRIVFADDDPLILETLPRLLNDEEAIRIVGTAANGRDALTQVALHHPDIALIDVDMPGLDGISTATEIRKRHPNTRVVMYTAFRHETTLAAAMGRVDISGFLTKDLQVRDLAAKLREAATGKIVFSDRPVELMTENYIAASQEREKYQPFLNAIDALPQTYRKVFEGLALAMPTKLIAQKAGLSETTVRTYASQIFELLGVANKAELAVTAARAGIDYASFSVRE